MPQPICRVLFALVFTPFAIFPTAARASDACSTIPIPPGQGTEASDGFGTAVQWLGSDLAVGAPNLSASPGGLQTGGVFVYRREGSGWVESQLLLASDGAQGDQFGARLAGTRTTLFVSAWGVDLPGASGAGAAYIFEAQGSSWGEVQKVSSAVAGSRFASSLAAQGRRLVVGAPHESGGVGAAYVYVRDTTGTWVLEQRLVPPDAVSGDFFASAVAVYGSYVAVASPFDDDNAPVSGSVYVFEKTASGWVLADKLRSPTPQAGALFGCSLCLTGERLGVGERAADLLYSDTGRAFLFERAALGSWVLEAELVPSIQQAGQLYGLKVEVEGDIALVSAPYWDHPLAANAGIVHAFRRIGSAWVETAVLRESESVSAGEDFGFALDLQDGVILAGEPGDAASGEARGGAYVFPDAEAPPGAELCFCDSGPCGNSYAVGGCRNFTGSGAWLHACGSASVALDDLVLVAEQVPAGQFGILYMGPALGAKPFGDGVRCVFSGGGVGVFRYPVRFSGPEGILSEGPGLVAFTQTSFPPPGRIQAGDTWYFQAWFRDPLGPCSSDFNLSNALEVTFGP